MSRGVTITGQDLHRFLKEMGVPIRPRGGRPPVAEIGDSEVNVPFDHRKERVDNNCITRLARAFGTDRTDMIEAITGKRRPNAGAYSTPTAEAGIGPSSKETLEAFDAVAARVTQIRKWLTNGQRSQEIRKAAYVAASAASKALEGFAVSTVDAAADAEQVVLERPDDSKFRPVYHDKLTTGAARFAADGTTARLAGKGSTETRHELVEKGEVAS